MADAQETIQCSAGEEIGQRQPWASRSQVQQVSRSPVARLGLLKITVDGFCPTVVFRGSLSQKYDSLTTVKLTPKNGRELRRVRKLMQIPMSFAGFVNFVLEKHGIPGMKDSELFKDATKI